MSLRIIIKRLSHPQVRKRLKIAVAFYVIAIIIGILLKVTYDIGYFNALSLKEQKVSTQPIKRSVLTLESAQRIIAGALNEDPSHPKTIVTQIIDNDYNLATVLIERDSEKKIAWIIDMHLVFSGDLLNSEGYNLTLAIERQHNINRIVPPK